MIVGTRVGIICVPVLLIIWWINWLIGSRECSCRLYSCCLHFSVFACRLLDNVWFLPLTLSPQWFYGFELVCRWFFIRLLHAHLDEDAIRNLRAFLISHFENLAYLGRIGSCVFNSATLIVSKEVVVSEPSGRVVQTINPKLHLVISSRINATAASIGNQIVPV